VRLNRRAVDRLLALDDKQFRAVILRLVEESGGDTRTFSLSDKDIAAIRHVLRTANDEQLLELMQRFKNGGRI